MARDAEPGDLTERAMFRSTETVDFDLPTVELAVVAAPASKAEPSIGRTWRLGNAARTAIAAHQPITISAIRRSIAFAVATEIDRGTAFLLVPVCIALGAIVYFNLASEPGFLPIASCIAVLLPMAIGTRHTPALNLALLAVLLFVVGLGFAKLETWRANTKMMGGEISTLLTGRVVATDTLANGRQRLTIDVTATERPTLKYAPDRIRVTARKTADEIAPGSLVTGLVRLMPPSGPVRAGSYDFSFESYFDGIGASGYFLRGPTLAAGPDDPPPMARFRAAVEQTRDAIAKRLRDRIGGPEGEIAAALVVGVRAGIPEDVNEALRRAGIYHVISISGLHMALVAGTIMGGLRLGFALAPNFASRRAVKKYAAALAILALGAYLFISGGEVAAQRSFIMLAVMLIAVLFDRAALTMRNLAISALVVLVVSPHEVTGPSFQMSFAATAALVGAYAAWSDYRSRRTSGSSVRRRSLPVVVAKKGMTAMAGLVATSIVAGGATAVYSAWHFQQMPSLGLFTNLTAMPVVSLLVMPFAVLGTLAMPFGLDGIFFDIMGWGLGLTVAIARWFAERSPVDMVGAISPLAVGVLTSALIVATVGTTWLRVAALPIALTGLFLLPGNPAPDVLVSEDGRLVGVAMGSGSIAVNRTRPSDFALDNWQRAMLADTAIKPVLVKPVLVKTEADGEGGSGASKAAQNTKSADRFLPAAGSKSAPAKTKPKIAADRQSATGFVCEDGLCTVQHPSGAIIAQAVDGEAAARACATARVIIIEDASARAACLGSRVLIVTGRDLARYGAASITLTSSGGAGPVDAKIIYSIAKPYRPWHEQRRFSREARGLPPYQKPAAPSDGKAPTQKDFATSGAPLPEAVKPSGAVQPMDGENELPTPAIPAPPSP